MKIKLTNAEKTIIATYASNETIRRIRRGLFTKEEFTDLLAALRPVGLLYQKYGTYFGRSKNEITKVMIGL